VGPNGSGKTTLFRMIVGEEAPDDGDVSVPRRLTVGYFRQDVEEMTGRSVLDEAIAGSGRVGTLHHELEELQHAMADPAKADQMDRILDRFGTVQEEYDHLGGYSLEAQAREVLHGLGFEDDRIDGDVGALSGGWKMRVAMARVLLGRPDVLLMDEPTNHLDIASAPSARPTARRPTRGSRPCWPRSSGSSIGSRPTRQRPRRCRAA
jgi:ATPase subunit of ABC transporter with duplicated ATPase domains